MVLRQGLKVMDEPRVLRRQGLLPLLPACGILGSNAGPLLCGVARRLKCVSFTTDRGFGGFAEVLRSGMHLTVGAVTVGVRGGDGGI